MVPGFDREALNMLGKLIAELERFHLEGAGPEEFDPGVLLKPIPTGELAIKLRPHFLAQGLITGIPSRKAFGGGGSDTQNEKNEQFQRQMAPPRGKQEQTQLERVIRGMYNATWAYIV